MQATGDPEGQMREVNPSRKVLWCDAGVMGFVGLVLITATSAAIRIFLWQMILPVVGLMGASVVPYKTFLYNEEQLVVRYPFFNLRRRFFLRDIRSITVRQMGAGYRENPVFIIRTRRRRHRFLFRMEVKNEAFREMLLFLEKQVADLEIRGGVWQLRIPEEDRYPYDRVR